MARKSWLEMERQDKPCVGYVVLKEENHSSVGACKDLISFRPHGFR